MIRFPRATMLPMLVVEAPLVVLTALASAVLYRTVFRDEPYPSGGILGVNEAGSQAFAAAIVIGVNVLFALIGQAATIVAVAGASGGRLRSLSESLDPAFTRMGALVMLTVFVALIVVGLALTLVGLIVVPYVALRLGIAFNVMMLEGLSPTRSIRRSWTLMKGHLLRFAAIVGLTFVVTLPLFLLSSIPLVPSGAGRGTRIAIDTASAMVEGIIVVPFAVLITAATTLYYLQVKARHDEPVAS